MTASLSYDGQEIEESLRQERGSPTDTIHFSRSSTLFAAIASIVFIVVGVTGNLVTILALVRSAKLRLHATTAFVISLCISDLLFCTINLPLTASRYIHESWVLGEDLCRIFPFFFYGNVAASLLNMVAITLNRYILISHHGRYDRIYQRKYIYLMILFIWCFSFGILVPPLVGVWGKLGLDPPTFSCTILKHNGLSPKKFLFLFGFLFPCIAIVVCYSAIYYKVRQSRRNLVAHASPSAAQGKNQCQLARKDDMRLTWMMLTIFICFVVSFFPLMIANVADDEFSVPIVHILASVLAWASAVLNPFVYAFTNRQYRAAYRKLFALKKRSCRGLRSTASKSNSSRTCVTEFQCHTPTGHVSPLTPTAEEP